MLLLDLEPCAPLSPICLPQFLLFYVCRQSPDHCCRAFLHLLISRLTDKQQPPIARAACAAYAASFLARQASQPTSLPACKPARHHHSRRCLGHAFAQETLSLTPSQQQANCTCPAFQLQPSHTSVSCCWVCAGLPSALRPWWWRACSASQTGACAMHEMRTGGEACHPSPPPTASRVSALPVNTALSEHGSGRRGAGCKLPCLDVWP